MRDELITKGGWGDGGCWYVERPKFEKEFTRVMRLWERKMWSFGRGKGKGKGVGSDYMNYILGWDSRYILLFYLISPTPPSSSVRCRASGGLMGVCVFTRSKSIPAKHTHTHPPEFAGYMLACTEARHHITSYKNIHPSVHKRYISYEEVWSILVFLAYSVYLPADS